MTLEPKDFITALIAIINIVVTIFLTIVNLYFIRRNQKHMMRRDTIIKRYMPILYALLQIQLEYNKACLVDRHFDIFDPSMQNVESKNNRIKIINTYYNYFLEVERNLDPQYFNKEIDSLLFNAKKHMMFSISIIGSESIMEINEMKRQYPLPDLDNLVQKISTFIGLV